MYFLLFGFLLRRTSLPESIENEDSEGSITLLYSFFPNIHRNIGPLEKWNRKWVRGKKCCSKTLWESCLHCWSVSRVACLKGSQSVTLSQTVPMCLFYLDKYYKFSSCSEQTLFTQLWFLNWKLTFYPNVYLFQRHLKRAPSWHWGGGEGYFSGGGEGYFSSKTP